VIIYLDGPINAGKSTVGVLLARRMPHTVHIEVDHLRHFAWLLTLDQAIPYALSDATSLAASWIKRGFHVVVSWPINRADHQRITAAIAETGAPLFTFTLLPRLDVALKDRGQRRLSEQERARIREMYAGMYAGDQAVGLLIDNSDQTAAETVQTILEHIKAESTGAAAEPPTGPVSGPRIVISDTPTLADVAFIRQRIKEFNDSVSGHHRQVRRMGKQALAALMRNESGMLIGGLLAGIYWGWLDIDELWVAEDWRGRGHGRKLMGLVEQAALKRDCRLAQVKTWDFQARGFYEQLGYQIVGHQRDFPLGQTFFWLRKELIGNDA
jgi:GNAT superfamily N-acetyltransferase